MERSPRRVLLLTGLVSLCLVSTPMATPWRQGAELPLNGETLVRHVRQALGRGAVDRARTLASNTEAPAEVRAVAVALVEIFTGQTTAARERLTPVADDASSPDGLLELGLLDLREGRRADGRRRLQQVLQQGVDRTPESLVRMARAAHALGDARQANTLFQRIEQVPMQQAEMETAWGDLLFERDAFGDAVRSYRAALQADPAWVGAHLGVSRAMATEDTAAADAALEQAVALAPDHPDVLLLTAERRLNADDRPAAIAALDRLAAVRPGTYDEIGLRASVAYDAGDLAEAEAIVARALTANPAFVDGHRLLGERAARAYRFADAAAYARKAVALDAEHANAHADLGLYLMRSGDEAGAREELERAFRLNPYDTVTRNLLVLLDTMAKFVEVESGPFVFKFAREEAEVLRPYAIPLAEQAYATFQKRYGFTPEGPILIEMFSLHDDFAVRTMGLMGLEGALGACFGRVIAMDSPMTIRSVSVSPFSWQATLWHEIAHVFSLQASDYRVPRWLTEGISVYEEHLRNPAWGRELTLEYARALSARRTFGVKGLPHAFQRPRDLSLAYFEASLLTEHLVSLNGDAGLRALLAAYAGGAKDPDAFVQAFGKSIDEVDASFTAFVEEQYGALARAMAVPEGLQGRGAPQTVESLTKLAAQLPDSYVVQWSLGRALYERGDLEEARAPLERAAALAPMARGETSPRAVLAAIADDQKDAVGASAQLRQLLAWDHANLDAARRLVIAARTANDTASEGFALRLIADVDPFDASAHAVLGRQALDRKDYEAALVELLASLALGPPNLAEAHADVAEAYLGLGRREDARKAALKALEQSPTYARAQDLLLATIGGGQ